MSKYQDADGATTTPAYHASNRPVTVTQKQPDETTLATQTLTYDDRDQVTQINDTQFGTITGTYDNDGNLTAETFPGGLKLLVTYDETGGAVGRCYTKSSTCTSTAWVNATGTKSIHDQWKTLTTTGL